MQSLIDVWNLVYLSNKSYIIKHVHKHLLEGNCL